jgi:hypothetical protein
MITHLEIIQTPELNEQVKKQVFDLWNSEYPEKLSYTNLIEFEDYLQNLDNLKHFLLTSDVNMVLGWALTFTRNNKKWLAIILSERVKGRGWGRKMLDEIKNKETELNGWVIDHDNDQRKDGLPYLSPLKFYEKCGFEVLIDTRLELDKISAVKIRWTNNELSSMNDCP